MSTTNSLLDRAQDGLKAPFDSANPNKDQAINVAVVYGLLGFLLSRL